MNKCVASILHTYSRLLNVASRLESQESHYEDLFEKCLVSFHCTFLHLTLCTTMMSLLSFSFKKEGESALAATTFQ